MRQALLIEDNGLFQSALRQLLESMGFSTVCAFSRSEALQYAEIPFDIIIFDYVDPGDVSPYQFIRRLQSTEANQHTPLIAMTGYSVLSKPLPVSPVLHKPFDIRVLEGHIWRAIRGAKSNDLLA